MHACGCSRKLCDIEIKFAHQRKYARARAKSKWNRRLDANVDLHTRGGRSQSDTGENQRESKMETTQKGGKRKNKDPKEKKEEK